MTTVKNNLNGCGVLRTLLSSPVTVTKTLGGERFFSVEYYAAQKAKRQRRGLVRFVGELYKLQMLTDKVVHDRIMRFLKDDLPGEEDIESVCMLLSWLVNLWTRKRPCILNAYFERMGTAREDGTAVLPSEVAANGKFTSDSW